jgi:hypothetical protein
LTIFLAIAIWFLGSAAGRVKGQHALSAKIRQQLTIVDAEFLARRAVTA